MADVVGELTSLLSSLNVKLKPFEHQANYRFAIQFMGLSPHEAKRFAEGATKEQERLDSEYKRDLQRLSRARKNIQIRRKNAELIKRKLVTIDAMEIERKDELKDILRQMAQLTV